MGYKSTHALFRDLTDKEVFEFKNHVRIMCKKGFDVSKLEGIHPIIRHELIKQIQDSLNEQNL